MATITSSVDRASTSLPGGSIDPCLLTQAALSPHSSLSESVAASLTSADVHVLMKHISALEAENARLSKSSKNPIKSLLKEGRAVRRLVSLAEPIFNMTVENDRCQFRLQEPGVTLERIQAESTPEQNRTFKNFSRLIACCPTASKLITEGKFDLHACREVQAGADSARGDDTSSLKGEVVHWITGANTELLDPVLTCRDKESRGMNHFVTGRLLCPVDYDWDDATVRTCIKEYHPDFRVTAHSWPRFLYKDQVYNPNSPSEGLFQSDLLVKAFKHIFTSPTSARRHNEGHQVDQSHWKTQRTRMHVADLLRMRTVQPRAIAYIVVQLRFALSSASSWVLVDEDFDYEMFYYHIVEYFEAPHSQDKSDEIQALLLWWNRTVFGRRHVSEYRPLRPEILSVARSCK